VRRLILLGLVMAPIVVFARPVAGLDSVRIHLKWLHSAQFAGLYAAEANGFFEEAGLDVELIDGAASEDVLVALGDGAYEFALADPSRHLALVQAGVPSVAVAAIFQIDPVVIFSLSESGIRRPEDLLDKRVMSFPTSYVIPAMLARVGLTVGDVQFGPPSYDLGELYSGAYDAWSGYLTNEVRRARADGHDITVIYPTDYGVHAYGDVLIARRDLVEADAELVQRVVAALLDGWIWVFEHPDEGAMMALQWDPSLDPAEQREILTLCLPFIHAGDVGLGGMTVAQWSAMAEMMRHAGILDPSFDEGAAYTLEFVDPVQDEGP